MNYSDTLDPYAYVSTGEDWFEDSEIVPVVQDTFNRVGWENFFHIMPQEQLEIMVCMYLGLKPLEIVKALQLKNIGKYYNASFKLRNIYRKEKGHFIDD